MKEKGREEKKEKKKKKRRRRGLKERAKVWNCMESLVWFWVWNTMILVWRVWSKPRVFVRISS